jgi:hypothetical protein
MLNPCANSKTIRTVHSRIISYIFVFYISWELHLGFQLMSKKA